MGYAIPAGKSIVNPTVTEETPGTPVEAGRTRTSGAPCAIESLPEDSIQNSIPARFEALAKRHPGKTAFEAATKTYDKVSIYGLLCPKEV